MGRGEAQWNSDKAGLLPLRSELPASAAQLISGEHLHFFCGRRPAGEIPPHRHEQFEISVLFEPAVCSVSWGQPQRPRAQRMTGPAVILMAPEQWHSYRWEREADVIVMHLERPLQRELRCARPPCAVPFPQASGDQVIWEIASGLRRLCVDNNPTETRALALVAKSVACRAIELLANPAVQAPTVLTLSDAEFRHVEEYMLAHLAHEIHVIDLARCVGYSPQHFNTLFKARAGVSAPVFLMQLRMAKAKDLFSGGARTIKTVAETVGYFDAGNFTAKFREHFGVSPRHVIRQVQMRAALVRRSESLRDHSE